MGRVLRISAGVMGVLLVVMTAGLWIRRATTEPEYGLVFWQDNFEDGTSALVLHVPELNATRQITPTFDSIGEYEYFARDGSIRLAGYESGTHSSTIFRLDLDTLKLTTIASVPADHEWGVLLAPNERWIIYPANSSCYLLDVRTGETSDFAVLFPEASSLRCSKFSEDSQWVFVDVYNNQNSYDSDTMRIRIRDNRVIRVGTPSQKMSIFQWSFKEKWLIGQMQYGNEWYNTRIYRSDPHNLAWRPVLPVSQAVLSISNYGERLVKWLPEYDLFIIYASGRGIEQIVAVPIDGGPPRWTLDNLGFASNLNYPDWLFFTGDDGEVYKMHPDGTDFTMIADLPPDFDSWHYLEIIEDQDGTEWLYMKSIHAYLNFSRIWRTRLDGSHLEIVVQYPNNLISIENSSPDHQWLLLTLEIDGVWLTYYKVRPDGRDFQLVFADPTYWFLEWALPTTKPFQPVLLFIIGIGLVAISIFGKRPYHLIR